MSLVLRLDESGSGDKGQVGGKAVNLGRLAQAGFPVPPGFTVTTAAYTAFLSETGLDSRIAALFHAADYGNPSDVESRTAEIRSAISATPFPETLASEVRGHYSGLGRQLHVAVRSSGTAEDLDEASFAGLHDTFLNVYGEDAVLEAIRGCWASLWTARAAVYRHEKGMRDPSQIQMAVVVQQMIEPDVSGVMFTANPMSTATDEVVINASWGLGESVVQGSVTPDEYVVKFVRPLAVGFERGARPGDRLTPTVKHVVIGSKETRMVRDLDAGHGNVTVEVPLEQQQQRTLTDAQTVELAELGRRVQGVYEQMPQDIEWAIRDGRFHLLQARPITGVAFDWAADMDSFQWAPDSEQDLWTGQFGLLLTGAKSPFYYSWVGSCDSAGYYGIGNALGIPELMGPAYYTNHDADTRRTATHQVHKYLRGEVYLNGEVEKASVRRMFLPGLRSEEVSPFLPPPYAEQVHNERFDYRDFVKSYAQLMITSPDCGLVAVLDRVQRFVEVDTAGAVSDYTALGDLTALSDDALKEAMNEQFLVATKYASYSMILYFVYWPQMAALFAKMISSWYTGDNEHAFAHLCQGVPTRSKTLEENLRLFDLADEIRHSEVLSTLFRNNRDRAFFDALADSEEGRGFLGRYREFCAEHGHRGHEDRCFVYPRRYEDPAVDYRNFQMLLTRDHPESPYELEEKLNKQREDALEDVLANVRSTPILGVLKAEAIKALYHWVHRFNALRDDERWAYERSSLCAKLYAREIGRRLVERDLLDDQEDFVLFTRDELFDLLEGLSTAKLARAKATQRRKDLDRAMARHHESPMFLRDGREVASDTADADHGLHGTGWTSGTVTATARVVSRLSEVDRVRSGDILICQSTDPGWTPVFMLLSGIVIETGGVLSHAVCLAREYGLPAVQLKGARKSIPDGAIVTVNGATGEIVVVDEPARVCAAEALEPDLVGAG